MSEFFALILATIVLERVITYVKTIFVDKKIVWQQIVAIVLGAIITIGYNIDLFALFGLVSAIPYLGSIMTAIIIAGGSNIVFDLLKQLQGYKTDNTDTNLG